MFMAFPGTPVTGWRQPSSLILAPLATLVSSFIFPIKDRWDEDGAAITNLQLQDHSSSSSSSSFASSTSTTTSSISNPQSSSQQPKKPHSTSSSSLRHGASSHIKAIFIANSSILCEYLKLTPLDQVKRDTRFTPPHSHISVTKY
jgi:hypothetical protein